MSETKDRWNESAYVCRRLDKMNIRYARVIRVSVENSCYSTKVTLHLKAGSDYVRVRKHLVYNECPGTIDRLCVRPPSVLESLAHTLTTKLFDVEDTIIIDRIGFLVWGCVGKPVRIVSRRAVHELHDFDTLFLGHPNKDEFTLFFIPGKGVA